MAVQRKTPTTSNTATPIGGSVLMNRINEEVSALWQYLQVPLSSVAGTNVITAACDVPLDTRRKGQKFTMTPAADNTGACTLNIDSKGAAALVNRDGSALSAGRLSTGRTEVVEYDGTKYVLLLDAPQTAGGILRTIVVYQLNQGTAAGAVAVGWNKYPLNAVVINEIPGLSVNTGTNQIVLPARSYDWIFSSIYINAGASGLHLWNVSDNIPFAGMARQAGNNLCSISQAGKFSLAAAKTAELRAYSTGAGNFGLATNISSPVAIAEQYGFIEIRSAS